MKKRRYYGDCYCDCKDKGKLKEVDSYPDHEGWDSEIFVYECVSCGKRYRVTFESYIQELED